MLTYFLSLSHTNTYTLPVHALETNRNVLSTFILKHSDTFIHTAQKEIINKKKPKKVYSQNKNKIELARSSISCLCVRNTLYIIHIFMCNAPIQNISLFYFYFFKIISTNMVIQRTYKHTHAYNLFYFMFSLLHCQRHTNIHTYAPTHLILFCIQSNEKL